MSHFFFHFFFTKHETQLIKKKFTSFFFFFFTFFFFVFRALFDDLFRFVDIVTPIFVVLGIGSELIGEIREPIHDERLFMPYYRLNYR